MDRIVMLAVGMMLWAFLGVVVAAVAFALTALLLRRPVWSWQATLARLLSRPAGAAACALGCGVVAFFASNGGPWSGLGRLAATVVLGLLWAGGIVGAARSIVARDPAAPFVGPATTAVGTSETG